MSAGVITHDSAEGHDAWRRFVGALCLIEFYARFVVDGCYLWNALHPGERATIQWDSVEWFPAIEHFADVLRAWAFLLLGRALWRGSGRIRLWTTVAIVASLAVIAADLVWFNVFIANTFSGFWAMMWELALHQGRQLPWLVVLVCVLMHRAGCWIYSARTSTWVAAAAAWCVAQTIVDCIPFLARPGIAYGYYPGSTFVSVEAWLRWGPMPRVVQIAITIAAFSFPVLLASLLTACQRPARIVALAIVATHLGTSLIDIPVLPVLVHSALDALMYSQPVHLESPFPFWRLLFFTQWSFLEWVVGLPVLVAPWLLIAHFIRTQPMARLPDDGSPWPRRYCGTCFYNLHGVESGRCPECGAELDEAGSAEIAAAKS